MAENNGLYYYINHICNYTIVVNNKIMSMNDTLFYPYYAQRYSVIAAIMLDSKYFEYI
ncbi:MAG: hypothetical protein KAY16_07595 [Spirochaetes bacterium]|nr:hypothetical protein [Spirochaetota bacterium]